MCDATEEHVARYIQNMHGRGLGRPGVVAQKALKNATMRQRLAAVRSLYDDLLRREVVAEHPCPRGALGRAGWGSSRGMFPRERTVPWIPDEAEWSRFLQAARPEPLRNRMMVLFAYEGALRRETLVGLELGDVDVSNRLVRLRPETMKGGRPGVVVTFSETTARAYVPHLHELKAQAGRSKASTKRVFRSLSDRNYGHPLTGSSWNKIVSAIAGRADLPGFTPHTFRHLRLTHMAQAGFKPLEIALYAGHSRTDTTMLYVHLSGRGLAAKIARNMRLMEERIAASFAETLPDAPRDAHASRSGKNPAAGTGTEANDGDDRRPLAAAEASEIERYARAIHAKGGRWRVCEAREALPRLIGPVLDALDTLHFVPERVAKPEEEWRRGARSQVLATVLRGMQEHGRAYWSWTEDEWRGLILASRNRLPVLAVAYRLCGVRASRSFPSPLSHCYLFQLLFGPEAWAAAEGQIGRLLSEWR